MIPFKDWKILKRHTETSFSLVFHVLHLDFPKAEYHLATSLTRSVIWKQKQTGLIAKKKKSVFLRMILCFYELLLHNFELSSVVGSKQNHVCVCVKRKQANWFEQQPHDESIHLWAAKQICVLFIFLDYQEEYNKEILSLTSFVCISVSLGIFRSRYKTWDAEECSGACRCRQHVYEHSSPMYPSKKVEIKRKACIRVTLCKADLGNDGKYLRSLSCCKLVP